jgi:DNA-3-methyladenine glycosylase
VRIPRAFYERDTVEVARDLLGKVLSRRLHGGAVVQGRIVETEAYHGPDDRASHAFRGRTPRTSIMFGPPGIAYVYQIYGVWFCLNAVTMSDGFPAAVLVRGVHLAGDDERAGAGPGKLCRAMDIDRRLNGEDLVRGDALWLEDDGAPAPARIRAGRRIGVDYAGRWASRPWRFWIDAHPAVSKLPSRRRKR